MDTDFVPRSVVLAVRLPRDVDLVYLDAPHACSEGAVQRLRSARGLDPHAAILGFSQGAILGAAIAALSQRGDLPSIAYAILVAGRVPRAVALAPD